MSNLNIAQLTGNIHIYSQSHLVPRYTVTNTVATRVLVISQSLLANSLVAHLLFPYSLARERGHKAIASWGESASMI